MLACDAPKCASVGRSDGLAFVEDGRIAGQERPIDDIGMSDDPADVGCGPEHLAGLDPVKILHRPQQSDHVTAIVAHDALGRACAPRRVEDVERVGSLHRDALGTETLRFSVRDEPRPIVVATRVQLRGSNRALEDDAALGLVSRNLDGLVEKRLVSDDAARLYTARARHDHLGLGIVEAFGELVAGEAAEHDRVDRTEASRGQHRDHCLRHHRHVNDDAVALFDAEPRQNGRERRHLVAKLTIGERPLGVRYRAIVNERVCLAASRHPHAGRGNCRPCCKAPQETSGRIVRRSRRTLCRRALPNRRRRQHWPRTLRDRPSSSRRPRGIGSSVIPTRMNAPYRRIRNSIRGRTRARVLDWQEFGTIRKVKAAVRPYRCSPPIRKRRSPGSGAVAIVGVGAALNLSRRCRDPRAFEMSASGSPWLCRLLTQGGHRKSSQRPRPQPKRRRHLTRYPTAWLVMIA